MELTVKEIKQKIVDKLVSEGKTQLQAEDEIKKKYDEYSNVNVIFKANPKAGYTIIASQEFGVDVYSAAIIDAVDLSVLDSKSSEFKAFNYKGFILKIGNTFQTKNSKDMMFVDFGDDTDSISFSIYDDKAIDKFFEGDPEIGDFVELKNLYWKDNTDFVPSFSDKSTIVNAVEPTFGLGKVVTPKIATMVPTSSSKRQFYTIKGTVVQKGSNFSNPFHCVSGHWFKGATQQEVGETKMCDKCQKPMDVLNYGWGTFYISDESGTVECSLSTFAEIATLNVMDNVIVSGEYKKNKDDDEIVLSAFTVLQEQIEAPKKN